MPARNRASVAGKYNPHLHRHPILKKQGVGSILEENSKDEKAGNRSEQNKLNPDTQKFKY